MARSAVRKTIWHGEHGSIEYTVEFDPEVEEDWEVTSSRRFERPMYVLTKDRVEVMRGTELECIQWVHKNKPYSFGHACKYEGYDVQKEVEFDAAFRP